MEFQKCKVEGVTKQFKEGLWVCALKEKCEKRLHSNRGIPFCKEPLVALLTKEIAQLRKEAKEDEANMR